MTETEMIDLHLTERADRVREHTATAVQAGLDAQLAARVRHSAELMDSGDDGAVTERIAELEQESDIERILGANAAALALTGTVLAGVHHRRWLLLPGVVTAFLVQHAVQGWRPPISLFRRSACGPAGRSTPSATR
ncbi:hypothetical protein [Streptomyces sodiiphilus]|uniref:hypothetical protein n=1 Tax=Streptomyces sodiiphilus TaxID=226217 RepID=UPI0031D3C8A5